MIRIRPGSAGYATEQASEEEASRLQNLVPTRDGNLKSRLGLTWVWDAPSAQDIVHVSNHPAGRVMAVANQNLYRLDPSNSWNQETIATGSWPSGVGAHLAHCSSEWQWVGCRASSQSTAGNIYRVVEGGTMTQITASYSATYLCAHNRLVLAANRSTGVLFWSDDGGVAGTWPAGNAMYVSDIGLIEGLANISDSQTLVVGSLGMLIVSGLSAADLTFQAYSESIGCGNGATIAKCGDKGVLWQDFGGQIVGFRAGKGRWDTPINTELLEAYPPDSRGFYVPGFEWYCLSNRFTDRTYILDLQRNQWIGFFDVVLTGVARPNATSQQYQRYPVVAIEEYLYQYGDPACQDTLTDGASATSFLCVIETSSSEQNLGEQKAIQKIFLDCVGTWDVFIYGRDNRDDAWTQLWTGTRTDSGWLYPTRHLYRQRKIRFEADSSSTILFREAHLFERKVRTER